MNATLCGAITFVGCLIAFSRGLLFEVADSQFDMLIFIIMHLNIDCKNAIENVTDKDKLNK